MGIYKSDLRISSPAPVYIRGSSSEAVEQLQLFRSSENHERGMREAKSFPCLGNEVRKGAGFLGRFMIRRTWTTSLLAYKRHWKGKLRGRGLRSVGDSENSTEAKRT